MNNLYVFEYDNCLSKLKFKRVNETTSYKTIDLGNRLVDYEDVFRGHSYVVKKNYYLKEIGSKFNVAF